MCSLPTPRLRRRKVAEAQGIPGGDARICSIFEKGISARGTESHRVSQSSSEASVRFKERVASATLARLLYFVD